MGLDSLYFLYVVFGAISKIFVSAQYILWSFDMYDGRDGILEETEGLVH
jgi:hypothetical protein